MSTIKVSVKWGKKKFDNIELNLEEPPVVFKAQLFTLSGVLPERQKTMVKGGMLKDEGNWSTLGVKEGHQFMMMGSAEEDIPKAPVEKVVFMEDLTSEDLANMDVTGFPAGLTNLGNTCYMNATLQCLKGVPELNKALRAFPSKTKEGDVKNNLTVAMKDLFGMLSNTNQPVPPLTFLQLLRTAFPQFAQKDKGQFMQQDAEECFTQLLITLGSKLPPFNAPGSQPAATPTPEEENKQNFLTLTNSAIGQVFSGEMISTLSNTDNADEPKQVKKETFHKLSCHISGTTNYLIEGLKSSLEEPLTKKSELTGAENQYLRSSKISKLPYYLNVQFVRFLWKQANQVKAKITRPVEFPLVLDIYDMCTEELKAVLQPKRKEILDIEDKKIESARKKLKEDKSATTSKGKEEVDTKKKDAELFDGPADPSKFVNETGIYELYAVLTHKGRNADSGHYVGWVKEAEDRWLKFDDDIVSAVNNEEIKKLTGKGGSDWHTAYLCFYRTKKADTVVE